MTLYQLITRSESMYNTIDELKINLPVESQHGGPSSVPYPMYRYSSGTGEYSSIPGSDFAG